ncbi:hypothetical protein THIOKS1850010 [Thiocapsa sp. KS1]|nr:DUF3109 family protein [Thiocapsa sp. KS1]CRI67810.1 hypothetical protein THIOKS1850010 [Thiocapsa sp. KS1]
MRVPEPELSCTAFVEEEFRLRNQLGASSVAAESLRRPLQRCDLTQCRGMCCYDGIYVGDEAALILQALADNEGQFFASLGVQLPKQVIVEGSWKGVASGKKTAVAPRLFSKNVPGFPAHFNDTACVFLAPDGRCSLQQLSEARGRFKWYYKPIGCWLHPITTKYGATHRVGLHDSDTDPMTFEDYPGWVTATFCGRTFPGGRPAHEVLIEELEFLSRIVGRDIRAELSQASAPLARIPAELPPVDLLPYGMALPLHLALAEADGFRRLHLLTHAFAQVVRFLALCLVSDYTARPEVRCPEGDAALGDLHRPALGHWMRVLQTIPSVFERAGVRAFLPECLGALKRLHQQSCEGCLQVDFSGPVARMSPLEAMLKLRNVLAHGALPPTEQQAADVYDRYLGHFARILGEFHFLTDVRLYRLVGGAESGFEALELRGPRESFAVVRLNLAGDERDGRQPGDCLLHRPHSEAYLRLAPLFVGRLDDDGVDGLSEAVFTFEGIGKRVAYYLGAARKVTSGLRYQSVIDTVFTQPTAASKWGAHSLGRRLVQATTETILGLRGTKYIPEVYEDRRRFSAAIGDLTADASREVCLLLVAESGAGKTSLLCHTAAVALADQDRSFLPLLLDGKNLSGGGQGQPFEPPRLGSLGCALAELFVVTGTDDWSALLDAMAEGLGVTDADGSAVRCLLLLDAVNEAADPYGQLREVDHLVGLLRRRRWMRCVVTVRSGAYDTLAARFKAVGEIWPRNERGFVRWPDESGRPSCRILLPRFSEAELRTTFERYRAVAASAAGLPACATGFDHLPEAIRQLCRHPLMLRLFMESFDGTSLEPGASPLTVFERFHKGRLSSEQAETALRVAGACLSATEPSLPADIAERIRAKWAEGRDDYSRLVCLDPLEQLLDLGVLLVDSGGRYRFVHQSYAEYMIGRIIGDASPTPTELAERIDALLRQPEQHLEEEGGAIRFVLGAALREGRLDCLDPLLARIGSPLVREYLIPLVVQIQRYREDAYRHMLRWFLSSNDTSVLESAVELYRTLGDRAAQLAVVDQWLAIETDSARRHQARVQRIRLLVMSNRVSEAREAIDRLRVEPRLERDDRVDLDLLAEEGYVCFITGRNDQAHGAYTEALSRIQAAKGLPEDERLFRHWDLLKGKGCVEHNTDDNAGCLRTHRQAISIVRRLEYGPGVALNLVNLADAHWGCHEYGASLHVYRDAIDASKRACFPDAIDLALIGRSMVLWSVGKSAEAADSLAEGLTVADELDYAWDQAYGLIYQSNVHAGMGNWPRALASNERALELADRIGAEYLLALGGAYLLWKQEVLWPAAPEHDALLEKTRTRCRVYGLRGIALMLETVALLRAVVSSGSSDDEVRYQMKIVQAHFDRVQRLKGPWELLGQQAVEACQRKRPRIDLFGLQDRIDQTVDEKLYSLDPDDREVFSATRVVWKA